MKGKVRIDQKTKNLVKRLKPHEIAVINHPDLDEVAARSLIAARVKAVINAAPFITGRYPNQGPLVLAKAGIMLIDNAGEGVLQGLQEGDEIEINSGVISVKGQAVAAGQVLSLTAVKKKMNDTKGNLNTELEKFVVNTLDYAKKELHIILSKLHIPKVKTIFKGRHTLIVVRGKNYKEDLLAIKSYIAEMKPVLIGVDGGADALIKFGYCPDLIIGDMDSISDEALKCGAELIVHAYPDGRAPGMERIKKLGLTAEVFPAPGTSEDIAMLLAYELGTELIVAVGSHTNMIDFLEKGRPGMASTFLVRLKVGNILIDAKGVNQLYRSGFHGRDVMQLFAAALLPFAAVFVVTPAVNLYLKLVLIKLRLIMHF